MIIKSMSRKQPSFTQLYDYIVRDNDNDTDYNFTHNFFSTKREDILTEFYDNAELLKKRMGSNYLYHEIISITRSQQLSEKQQKELLRDITQQYINERAKDCLVFAGLHDEKENQLHYHLIISANKLDEKKRYYHSKQGFEKIKVQLEEYVLQRYPELEQEKLISKEKTLDKNGQTVKSIHANKKEGEYIRRTGKLSKKQQTANRIRDIFLMSDNLADYTNRLRTENIESYVRGKTMGFVVDGKKHRLHTLGISEEFDDMLLRFQENTQEKNQSQKQTNQQAKFDTNTTNPEQSSYDKMVAKRQAELKQRYQQKQASEQNKSQDKSR
ncbi:MAG: hypothetical protein KGV46_00535 [Pasteurella sp.]|nr:hypothetical protein [Pasteurella sp.]MBS9783024.1 hypothetical protein [Pasteurella sp.]